MRKKKGNNAQVIIVLLFILIIISMIVSLVFIFNLDANKTSQNQNKSTEKRPESVKADEYTKNDEEFIKFEKEYQSENILPRNISVLYQYKGENKRQDVYESLKAFTKLLSKIKNDIKDSDEEKYFDDNFGEIYKTTGMSEFEDFQSLIKMIKEKDVNADNFKYAEIEINSLKSEDLYSTFNVNLYYGDNNEKVKVGISFANSKLTDPEFKYEIK